MKSNFQKWAGDKDEEGKKEDGSCLWLMIYFIIALLVFGWGAYWILATFTKP